jgi:hypothetical protein
LERVFTVLTRLSSGGRSGRFFDPSPPALGSPANLIIFETIGRGDLKRGVVVPKVFSPTKFCRRIIIPKERLQVLDVPAVLVKSLEERKALELFPRLDVPIKVIVYMGTCIGACLASWPTTRPERKREAGSFAPGATDFLERANKKRGLGLSPTIPGAVAPGGLAGDPRQPAALDTRRHFRYYIPPDPEDLKKSKAITFGMTNWPTWSARCASWRNKSGGWASSGGALIATGFAVSGYLGGGGGTITIASYA